VARLCGAAKIETLVETSFPMNNSELDSILKKARVPERPNDFWEMFPRQVIARLNRGRTQSNRRERPAFARWAWGLGAAACVLMAFAAGHWRGQKDSGDVLQSLKLVDETLAMFPHRVRAIVQDEHGLNLILSEHGDVPVSSPLYVRICDGRHCSSLVTFSGQEIQFAGQKLTVLSDPRGGIILEGNQFLWSSTEPIYAANHLKIEARNLGLVPM
jgi:hypothetical protein